MPHVVCKEVFEKPSNDQAEDNSKANADQFCRAMGYPGAAVEEFSKVDMKINMSVLRKNKDKIKLIIALPEFDEESKK